MSELELPPIAQDEGARELLRVWASPDMPQQFVLKTTWKDPGAWGLLLVDIARHASKAYAAQGGISEADAMNRIQEYLLAELNIPTDTPKQLK